MLTNNLRTVVSSIVGKNGGLINSARIQLIEKRYKHETSKARIYETKNLDDGSQFISRVPLQSAQLTIEKLPPPIKNIKPRSYNQLSPEEITSLKELRATEPKKWTRSALAKKFNCSQVFVKIVAPADKEYHDILADKQTEQWNKNGYKKQLIYINRQRRRALW